MARLRLTLLGGFDARLDPGVSLVFRRKKAQALLAYLALEPGQTHPRDKLAALLWGDATDPRARHSLRQVLVDLRRILVGATPPPLTEDGDGVTLTVAAVDVDVTEFARLMADATPAALADAAQLYRGDLLAGLGAQSPAFEEWLVTERETLREMAMQGLAKLLAQHTEGGAIEPAIQTAVRLLGFEPTLEPVHRALMRLYARQGRRGAALRQYQACVAFLDRELGVAPEAETRDLYRGLLQDAAGTVPESRAPAEPRSQPGSSPPLVGRDAELVRLRAARAAAWRGEGTIVLVQGEPGIGKTRLAEALVADVVEAGGHAVVGHAWETERILPFGPWVDAFRASDVVPTVVNELAPSWRVELVRLFPEIDSVVPPATEDHLRLFEAMARVVERLAESGPLLVLLDDLHWADEMSLRLLAFVVRRAARWRVLLAGTLRTDELTESPWLRRLVAEVERVPGSVVVTLVPLSKEHITTLAGRPHVVDHVWRVSRGNPFIATEMLRALHERGPAPDELSVPTPVRDVIAARLDRLGEPAQHLVAVAAVIGREFEFDLVAGAAGLDAGEAAGAVEQLVGRRLLHVVGERLDFTHDLLRDVVYARLVPPRRRLLHRAVADALAARGAGTATADGLALGRHYYESEEWERALIYLRQAGDAAAERCAHREAVACFDRALSALERLPATPERTGHAIDIRFVLRNSLFAIGHVAQMLERLREAERLARALGDELRLSWALVLLAHVLGLMGRYEDAFVACRHARMLAPATDVLGLSFIATYYVAATHFLVGEFREAAALFRENMGPLRRHDAPEPSRFARSIAVVSEAFAAMSLAQLGEFDEAIATGHRGVERGQSSGTPWDLFQAHLALGSVYAARGDFAAAIPELRRSLATCEAWDLPGGAPLIAPMLGYALAHTGALAEALEMVEPITEPPVPFQFFFVGEVYLRGDRLDEAAAAAMRGLEMCHERSEVGWEAWTTLLCGRVDARRRANAASAEAQYRAALEVAEARGLRPLAAHCYAALGELHTRHAQDAEARAMLDAAAELYRSMGMRFWLGLVEEQRARLGSI
jgi:DNA-binding SARP family transcriptional activator